MDNQDESNAGSSCKDKEAEAIILKYLHRNAREIVLDDTAKEILGGEATKYAMLAYCLYEPDEINSELEKAGIKKGDLSRGFMVRTSKLYSEGFAGTYFHHDNGKRVRPYILLRKKIKDPRRKICTFMHEFRHFQYDIGSLKSKKPKSIEIEEEQCNIVAQQYAVKMDFLLDYLRWNLKA